MVEERIHEKEPILQVKNVSISFQTSAGMLNAIRGVSFTLHKGETVAIVGESGSGKSVTVKSIVGIQSSNQKINSGEILYTFEENGKKTTVDLLKYSKRYLINNFNGKKIAMVFQDPMTALNPLLTIGKQLTEGMIKHLGMTKDEAWKRGEELLDEVGIPNPQVTMKNYPHQLSGGMRQRVVIAIAISCNPDILICDEPTTALDVTIQARILNLIKEMQNKHNISVIFITHDLGVVAKVADYVCVANPKIVLGTKCEYAVYSDGTWYFMLSDQNDDELREYQAWQILLLNPTLILQVAYEHKNNTALILQDDDSYLISLNDGEV